MVAWSLNREAKRLRCDFVIIGNRDGFEISLLVGSIGFALEINSYEPASLRYNSVSS